VATACYTGIRSNIGQKQRKAVLCLYKAEGMAVTNGFNQHCMHVLVAESLCFLTDKGEGRVLRTAIEK
jgi:hypothetical protein